MNETPEAEVQQDTAPTVSYELYYMFTLLRSIACLKFPQQFY